MQTLPAFVFSFFSSQEFYGGTFICYVVFRFILEITFDDVDSLFLITFDEKKLKCVLIDKHKICMSSHV